MRRHLAAAWLAAVACAAATAGTITGSATYRERIALPPNAVFEAELQDVSRADAPAVVLGRARLDPAGLPPFRFEIPYDDAAIRPGARYAVRATIRVQGQLRMTTTRMHPVMPGQTAPVNVLLVGMRGQLPPGPQTHLPPATGRGAAPLAGSYEGELPGAGGPILWRIDIAPGGTYVLRRTYLDRTALDRQVDEIGRWTREPGGHRVRLEGGTGEPVWLEPLADGTLRKLDIEGRPIESTHPDRLHRLPRPLEPRLVVSGLFRYLADAAVIELCADGRRLPVAMEGDYLSLERAYLALIGEGGLRGGDPMLAEVDATIAPRPSMEETQPLRPTVIVESFGGLQPRSSCASPTVGPPPPR
jgi:uncharacterized lipoprotein YbaY/uncharacterized lipoprotein NlpE involved in copper resistance